ncbi:MAG: histidine kinase [Lentimicrobiaceae bacterium]|nr:histidine kinase [Lentimicrobiaceae bacterium]
MFTSGNFSKSVAVYFGAWILSAGIHFFVIYFRFHIALNLAIGEAFVFNIIPALLGIGLWFLVKFADFEKFTRPELLVRHLSMGAIILFVWNGSAYFIMNFLSGYQQDYVEWLDRTLLLRVVAGFLIYVIMVSVFYLLINNQNLNEQKIREEALKNLLHQSELNTLKAQVKPHFLFNALNSISSLTISDPQKAQEMVINLSEFMRYSLSFSNNDMSTLGQELHHIKLYLAIEKVRFGDRLQINEEIQPGMENRPLPSMVLQPLIENAIKHGIYNTLDSIRIDVKAVSRNEKLLITIANPYDASMTNKQGTGTGLENVFKRLQMIYGINDVLEVFRHPGIFEVRLNIP